MCSCKLALSPLRYYVVFESQSALPTKCGIGTVNPVRQTVHWCMKAFGLDDKVDEHQVNHWIELREQRRHPVMDPGATNLWLGKLITDGRPAAIAKLGSSECWTLAWHLEMHRFYKYTWCPPSFGDLDLAEQSGVFPNTEETFHRFAKTYLERLHSLDGSAVWQNSGEGRILKQFAPSANWISLRGLEPYTFDQPWSRALQGKRILVIHPFEESIRSQFARRDLVWRGLPDVLPDCEIEVVRAPYGFSKSDFRDWFEMLKWLEDQIENAFAREPFHVALIGCGAPGLPLAAKVKELGGIGIHLGGPLQLLFGIRGRRWDDRPEFQRLFNEYWVRPRPGETPELAAKVDNGGYW